MPHPFDPEPWYKPERDGTLEEYFQKRDSISQPFPLFKGYAYFEKLWNGGYFLPDVSAIRLMWNVGRYDEHFLIRGQDELVGIPLPAHGGRPGIHDPKKILSKHAPPWEAQMLNLEKILGISRR